jgi:hypothetical protein
MITGAGAPAQALTLRYGRAGARDGPRQPRLTSTRPAAMFERFRRLKHKRHHLLVKIRKMCYKLDPGAAREEEVSKRV